MKNANSLHHDVQSYLPPFIEVMDIQVEAGFAASDNSQQEPSPWDDM